MIFNLDSLFVNTENLYSISDIIIESENENYIFSSRTSGSDRNPTRIAIRTSGSDRNPTRIAIRTSGSGRNPARIAIGTSGSESEHGIVPGRTIESGRMRLSNINRTILTI